MRVFSSATLVAFVLLSPTLGRASVQSELVRDDNVVFRAVIEHTIIPTHRRTYSDATDPLPVVSSSSPLCQQRSMQQGICRIPDQWRQFLVPDASRNWPGLVDDERTRRELVASLEARNAKSHPLTLTGAPGVVLVEANKDPGPRTFERSNAADLALLSALALAYGSTIFTVSDLLTTTNPELRALLADCRARRLGVWLRRIHRHPGGPYRLVCIKRTGAGRVWCVCPSPSARIP